MTPRPSATFPLFLLLSVVGCGGGSGDAVLAPADGAGTGTTGIDDGSDAGGASSANGVRLVEIATTLGDGRVRTESFGWDDEGRLLSETLLEAGVTVETRRYTWPDAQRFVSREDDIGGDGNVDRFLDFSFTPEGKLGSARIDGADGSPIGTLVYSVGDSGNVESLERSEADALVRRETYSYSDGGELESSAIDTDGDGSIDFILGYEYAEDGSVASTIESEANPPAGGGGELTSVWTYERGECIRGWFNSTYRPYCVTFR